MICNLSNDNAFNRTKKKNTKAIVVHIHMEWNTTIKVMKSANKTNALKPHTRKYFLITDFASRLMETS